jgi:hypothetical protein
VPRTVVLSAIQACERTLAEIIPAAVRYEDQRGES